MSLDLLSALREVFSLERKEQALKKLPLATQLRVRREFEEAVGLLRNARRTAVGTLRNELAHRAVRKLLDSFAISLDPEAAEENESKSEADERHSKALSRVFSDLREQPISKSHLRTLNDLGSVGKLSDNDDHTYLRLARFFAWLEPKIETRTLRQVRLERVLRPLAALLLVAAGAWWLWAPHNLALNKTVTASSICRLLPLMIGANPLGRAVDGIRREAAAVCTRRQVSPWLAVDLEKAHTLTEVVIYNRGDCCWGVDELPLQVQISLDNQNFKTIATLTKPFTEDFPARVSVEGKKARYVRLMGPAIANKMIVINELEVYGY